eukprot:scaffold26280_cov58-Phaeocystis_antarctica.AAC.4
MATTLPVTLIEERELSVLETIDERHVLQTVVARARAGTVHTRVRLDAGRNALKDLPKGAGAAPRDQYVAAHLSGRAALLGARPGSQVDARHSTERQHADGREHVSSSGGGDLSFLTLSASEHGCLAAWSAGEATAATAAATRRRRRRRPSGRAVVAFAVLFGAVVKG